MKTEIAFILDRSGSMQAMTHATLSACAAESHAATRNK